MILVPDFRSLIYVSQEVVLIQNIAPELVYRINIKHNGQYKLEVSEIYDRQPSGKIH